MATEHGELARHALDPRIAEALEHWLKKAGSDDPFYSERTVGLHEALNAHYLIADHFARRGEPVGLPGPRNLNLLESALSRQFTGFGAMSKWNADTDVVATLFFGLVMDHPFHDGNKRTALLCALYHLNKLGRTPTVSRKDLETLTLRLAEKQLAKYSRYSSFEDEADADVLFLAWWFRRNTRDLDKRKYTITYEDLQAILHRHGFRLEAPSGNQINVVRETVVKPFLRKPRSITERVCQIGFPRWTIQVPPGVVAYVRKMTGLTAENGCDSQSFFFDTVVLRRLIDEYAGLLRRLRDR